MKKKKRLLWQLFPSYLLITLISLGAVTIYATTSLKDFYLDQIASDLQSRAYILEKQMLQLLEPIDFTAVDALCKKIVKASDTRITVILPNGKVVGDSDENPARMDNHALRPEIIVARKGGVGKSVRFSKTLQKNMMYVAIPLNKDGRRIAVLRTSIPVSSIDEELKSIETKIALGGLLIAILAAVMGLYVSRRISRPIEEIKKGAEQFARGELSHRLPDTDLEEIGSLVDALNQMAVQLDDRIKMIMNQRNELEAVLSSMEEGVIALDVDERILSINQAAARIFGRKPEDFLHRTLQEVIRNPEMQEFVSEALTTPEKLRRDITLYNESERIIHTHTTSLFNSTGHSTGILIVLNDVTQLRQLENMRKDFAANVSHEIKTPLTAIKGFVETLLHSSDDQPGDTGRFIGIIEKHVNRLVSIVDDLISLSKIEQEDELGEIRLNKGRVFDVARRAVGNCKKKAESNEVNIELIGDENISAMIDERLLEQAVTNLVDNAINYSDPNGIVQVSVLPRDSEVVVRVQDHGIGIAKEHHSRLFERFYRVDKARSRKIGGTGLGLAIVKHIVQAHGGRVSVESTPGKGSTFSLHIPSNITFRL